MADYLDANREEWEALALAAPSDAADIIEQLDEADAIELLSELPPALDEVVARATASDPGERYGSVELFVAAFAAAVVPGLLVLIGMALVSCTAPTLRALRIAPTEALKAD